MMKSEWKKLQKDQLMKGKKDNPAKEVANLAELEHSDDNEFEDYEADSDAASVSSFWIFPRMTLLLKPHLLRKFRSLQRSHLERRMLHPSQLRRLKHPQ